MKIYRIENQEGRGPYQGFGFSGPGELAAVSTLEGSPNPSADPGLRDWWSKEGSYREYYFGFENMTQLKDWFPQDKWKHIEVFNAKYGQSFSIYEYDVLPQDVKFGDKQICFKKKNALGKTLFHEFLAFELM